MKGMQVIVALALFLSACVALSTNGCHVVNANVAAGYCARVHYSGFNRPRGIKVLDNNDIIIINIAADGVTGSVNLIYDTIEGNVSTRASVVLATQRGLIHGITFDGSYIYASNVTYVFRWPYTLGSRTPLIGQETVISNMPTYTSHDSRTLLYDPTRAAIIVSVGSQGNIDASGVPGLYRFPIANFPSTFSTGTVIATGLRNEVGIKFDTTGRLWGVENGVDNLRRSDLGGDIHNEHPGEELNLFERDGGFYGYPFCWSMYRNFTQYAWESFLNDGTTTDAWCQNTSNVILPKYVLRAHTAPLDITFYSGSQFPGATGDAFVSQHGSWNRIPPAGYAIVHVNMENGVPTSDEKIFSYSGPGEFPPQGSPQWYRPVSMDWAKCEGLDCLLFTSDSTGDVLSIKYSDQCDCDIVVPTTTTTTATATTTTTSSASILSVSVVLASIVLAVYL